tara:strand:- start:36 stop:761 length:726 start_codon:yes stop_codon:yes gene_type:complete
MTSIQEPTAEEFQRGIRLFTYMRNSTMKHQKQFKLEVIKKQKRTEEFKGQIALDPLLMKMLKNAIEKHPFNTEKIKALTINNQIWIEDYCLGQTREDAGGLKTICDEKGVPMISKMKEIYFEKIEYAKQLTIELEHAKDGEKFWRYCHYCEEEKLGKYHEKMNEYNSEFLQEAMEADSEGEKYGVLGVAAGRDDETKTYKMCGETIRLMGISMKSEYELREEVISAVKKLNRMGCGKQLIK